MSSPSKQRLDLLLVERGLASSRTRAQSLIMAGKVVVDDHLAVKASETYLSSVHIRLKGPDHPYVGRGGLKLESALTHFSISPKDKICVDIGASTGGFTDCLLQKGAQKVYAIDVGTNQLDWRLRNNPKVVAIEKQHILKITQKLFEEAVDFVVMDVSFISVTKILPFLVKTLPGSWDLLFLIKPQFEVGKSEVPKGGVVKNPQLRNKVCQSIERQVKELLMNVYGIFPSPVLGDKGNQEFFLYSKKISTP